MSLQRLTWRNLRRNPFRVCATIAAVAVAVVAFVIMQTVQTAWSSVSDNSRRDHLVVMNAISYAAPLPFRYANELKQIPHVVAVTTENWLGGRDPAHDQEFFGSFAVDRDSYFDMFSELTLTDGARAGWQEKKDAAIVGDVLANKLGWKVGDRIHLESGLYAENPLWTFELVGTYNTTRKSRGRSDFYLRWDYFNEQIGSWHNDQVGWFIVKLDDPANSAQVANAVDAYFATHPDQTFTQNEEAFIASLGESMSSAMGVLDVACFAILIIMVLLIGNTLSMTVRERSREYGTLRAIGFPPPRVALFIVGESVLVGALGGALGIGASLLLVGSLVGSWIEANLGEFLPYFNVAPSVAAAAFGAAIAASLLAAALPALLISRIEVTKALRQVA